MNQEKKYKLLKEYLTVNGVLIKPGAIFILCGGELICSDPANAIGYYISSKSLDISGWFEPVVEKDWEILEIMSANGCIARKKRFKFEKGERDYFTWDVPEGSKIQGGQYTEDFLLNGTDNKIRSVKRLKDSIVFTVGDSLLLSWDANDDRITKIDVQDDDIRLWCGDGCVFIQDAVPLPPQSKQEWWRKLGIKFDGKWYTHPQTNTYDNLDQVMQELRDLKSKQEPESIHLPAHQVQINISFTHKNEGETSTVISYGFSVPFTGVVEEKYPALRKAIEFVLGAVDNTTPGRHWFHELMM